jgi:hypothetical protein
MASPRSAAHLPRPPAPRRNLHSPLHRAATSTDACTAPPPPWPATASALELPRWGQRPGAPSSGHTGAFSPKLPRQGPDRFFIFVTRTRLLFIFVCRDLVIFYFLYRDLILLYFYF